jgi:dihydroxyacid dehydratase/phosphogluconate dehydratase
MGSFIAAGCAAIRRMYSDGRPIIGICNTGSELTPCNAHFRDLAERVKRGVWEAAGFPLEFPVTPLEETNIRPTAMRLRNLVSMDVEESIRAHPLDGVVLLCGFDKTVPALIMGAASCDLPTMVVSGRPMLNGKFRGADIGSGTDVGRFSEEVRAGTMCLAEFLGCCSKSARDRLPRTERGTMTRYLVQGAATWRSNRHQSECRFR